MRSARRGAESLEERVLRVLYEGPASARECAVALNPYAGKSSDQEREVEVLLYELAQRAHLRIETEATVVRFALTHAGSERLATLVE